MQFLAPRLKMKKEPKFLNENGKHWRIFANIWMVIAIIFFILSFFWNSFYSHLANITGVIYLAVLGIYVGTKEFNRWSHYHKSIHFGELSVVIWTVLLVGMLIVDLICKGAFNFSNELIALYIAVLGIFAITQKSKSLYKMTLKK